MNKTVVDVPALPDSTRYGFVQCVAAGDLIFAAGQTGVDASFEPVSDDFVAQARQTFKNVDHALTAAGSGLSDIVMMTVYLTDMRNSEAFWKVREEFLGDTLAPSALIGVSQLWAPNVLVEVQAIGVRRNGH